MKVTRKSMFSGIKHTMEIPVTEEQLQRYANNEGLIQDIMPYLSPDQREFIMTGVTPDEWEEMFGEDED